MRSLLAVAFLAVLSLSACAPDDQEFDISALLPEHHLLFRQAADDLNKRHPNIAHFSFSTDAHSYALYAQPSEPDILAETSELQPFFPGWGWEVRFSIEYLSQKPKGSQFSTFQISAEHELCHVLGIDHSHGNPVGSHC